ncbi:MAG TPA: nuclear transport factor 2 family protein [Mycobacterium sp.]|nr:nuclear transport factor 2 family protein [Mycobacterium sp.]
MTSVADRMFAAMEAGDVDAVTAMWAPDISVWHAGEAHTRDKSRARRVIDWFISASADRHYDVLTREEFGSGFVQQQLLSGHCRDGTPYALRTAIIVVVGPDGLITRIDEYFDPADLAPLLETTEVICQPSKSF